MYVVRCDTKNGVHREYGFFDLAAATTAYDTLKEARKAAAIGSFHDEGGRAASIDGRELMIIELVDVQAETVTAMKMIAEVQAIQRQFGMAQQPPAQPQNVRTIERDEAPEYAPAIGRTANFAS